MLLLASQLLHAYYRLKYSAQMIMYISRKKHLCVTSPLLHLTQQRRAQMGRNTNDEGWRGEPKLAIMCASHSIHCQASKQYCERHRKRQLQKVDHD